MDGITHSVARLRTDDLPALAHHRHRESWALAPESIESYLLKAPASEETTRHFSRLPLTARWNLSRENSLIPQGRTLPDRALPTLAWQSLASTLPPTPAAARPCEYFFGHIPIELIPSTAPIEPTALLTTAANFLEWATNAAAPRLAPLRFAVSSENEVLVIGTPLPPISGKTLTQESQLLIPSGFTLPTYLTSASIAASLKLPPRQFALLGPGDVHIIAAEQFVAATRASIRTTLAS